MLELSILGFLAAGPLPGHELRRRITHLTGYSRPVSDGTLYPAINRLTKAGLIQRRPAPEAGGGRYVLNLTDTGREDMLRRLREPAEHELTDFPRWFTILAFLSLLPDVADQHAVLRRRLAFLEESASFFYDGETPLRAEEVADPYRRGMLLTARATSQAERTWIRESLGQDTPEPGPTRDPHASSPLDASAS
ncbi:PadR family transcriptional regulator [Streptomyces europaeiscabiei]|uniref:PadR family transcriptional regulator n=1 Tax=Streptomyces europaeiscabiei TaxID=146819 RepID=UPI002E107AEA|nr:PadR family transcriptional regulator [Streptomyces europaeiscabiei]